MTIAKATGIAVCGHTDPAHPRYNPASHATELAMREAALNMHVADTIDDGQQIDRARAKHREKVSAARG
jgi:hypothetical protein